MIPTNQAVDTAFSEKPSLKASIHEVISKQPGLGGLFSSISEYIIKLRNQSTATGTDLEEPAAKKRRLNGNSANGTGQGLPVRSNDAEPESMSATWTSIPPIEASFSVPQRKKLLLQISPKTSEGIRALNPGTQEKEFGIPWRDIEHVVCLPVPEKAQVTYNFCVFPRSTGGAEGSSTYEPMVWTVPEIKPKEVEEGKTNLRQMMIEAVKGAKRSVLEPGASEFVSEVLQAYRKGEKAYHVKAFRGSKDGFLFFLSTGIVWAFKKPLHFFSFDTISSISYTSVLQRTFNLNLTTQSSSAQTQEFEFSMIDQADFAGIDAYIKRHRLQDSSMAEERRAKKLNINGLKGEPEVEDGEQESELQKAAREAEVREGEEDDEDEEDDENFDPGSEGESEGSGTSDEEEEDGAGGGGGEGGHDEGSEEELGSEDEMAE